MKSELDKFYTKKEVAQHLISTISGDFDLWLEPSAGAGAFLKQLPHPRIGLDIESDDLEIQQMDFFDWEPPKNTNQKIAVVGNPPFGKNSSLAIEFFNEAAKWASLIAFIVPRTFRKTSVQNRLSLSWVLKYEEILDENSFILLADDGTMKDYKVSTCWQIWEPGKRKKLKLDTAHKDWIWCSKNKAAFAMRRVGGLAGKCFKDNWQQYSVASHYYFNCNEEVYNRLDNLYEDLKIIAKDTAGNPSLAKSELVKIYKERYD